MEGVFLVVQSCQLLSAADHLLVDLSSEHQLDAFVVSQSALAPRHENDADSDSFRQLAVEHLQVVDSDITDKLEHLSEFQENFASRLSLHLNFCCLVCLLQR
jgi:hypothetical protein